MDKNRIQFSQEYKNAKGINKNKAYYLIRSKIIEAYRLIKYNLLNKKDYEDLSKSKFPTNVQIEPSAQCNASCITCPQKSIKRKGSLPIGLIKKILDECAKHEVKEIYPINYNEFFLYPHAIEMLRYIKEKLPRTKVVLFTNASVLTNEISDIVISEKLIYHLNFSLDAFKKETYELMRGLSYQNVMRNIMYFIKKNSEAGGVVKTGVTFTITDKNEKEIKQFRNFWKRYTNNIHFSVDDGRKNKNPYISRKTDIPCHALLSTPVILCNGDVVSCCMDPHGTLVYGNILHQSLEEIWNCPKYKNMRKLHLLRKRQEIPLCRDCPML